jgi:hypothetical protein
MSDLAATAGAATIMASPFIVAYLIVQTRELLDETRAARQDRRAKLDQINARRRSALVQYRRAQINRKQNKGNK